MSARPAARERATAMAIRASAGGRARTTRRARDCGREPASPRRTRPAGHGEEERGDGVGVARDRVEALTASDPLHEDEDGGDCAEPRKPGEEPGTAPAIDRRGEEREGARERRELEERLRSRSARPGRVDPGDRSKT